MGFFASVTTIYGKHFYFKDDIIGLKNVREYFGVEDEINKRKYVKWKWLYF